MSPSSGGPTDARSCQWPIEVPSPAFGDAVVEACRRGETVVVSDVHTDPGFTDAERAPLLASEIAAFVGAPLIKEGRWLATFAVHSATPRTWTQDEIALVEMTAQRIWGAGERAARGGGAESER